MKKTLILCFSLGILYGCKTTQQIEDKHPSFSGVYPHLAMYNNEGECGTGAVVPWQGELWAMTYAPHKPYGSSDKLYQISSNLDQTIRKESVGGTPANRMIHKESNQLFMGPYAIGANGTVKVIPYKDAPGRYTGNARHLTNPENKIYIGTMEEGFYEVDVNTLEVNTLFEDGNVISQKKGGSHAGTLLPGYHGKGLYSGQGVLVYANNGELSDAAMKYFDAESGALAEWNGKDWKLIRRNQFTEVTGPGGIHGNPNPETDPIWSIGWDYKSLLLGVRDPNEGWTFFRLPKASNSYDGAHGWNTEWPRIRNIGTEDQPDYMMTMHGMFWKFPGEFSTNQNSGLRPRSAYLKVIGDFAPWKDKVVIGCDDSAKNEFLNKRKAKGGIGGPGQSNSNLWFIEHNELNNLGPTTAAGSIWLNENVDKNTASDPFLFAGWQNRSAWIQNNSNYSVTYTFELDLKGNGQWSRFKEVTVPANSAEMVPFSSSDQGEWIRVSTNKDAKSNLSFAYSNSEKRSTKSNTIFAGLDPISSNKKNGALLYGLGDNIRKMGLVAKDEKGTLSGYYEIDSLMNLTPVENPKMESYIKNQFSIPENIINIEEGSALIIDDSGRRWRLPLSDEAFINPTNEGELRICREVATERDLFNCMGTFYELPAENADGYAKIRPVSSHRYRIHDYASYRGLLILSGLDPQNLPKNSHIIQSEDGKVALWVGVIDDLWKLGKPVGKGGPWINSKVEANTASDPYLIGHYENKTLTLSHNEPEVITVRAEVDPTGDGAWITYKEFTLQPNQKLKHKFENEFNARWIRFVSDKNATITTWLEYK